MNVKQVAIKISDKDQLETLIGKLERLGFKNDSDVCLDKISNIMASSGYLCVNKTKFQYVLEIFREQNYKVCSSNSSFVMASIENIHE